MKEKIVSLLFLFIVVSLLSGCYNDDLTISDVSTSQMIDSSAESLPTSSSTVSKPSSKTENTVKNPVNTTESSQPSSDVTSPRQEDDPIDTQRKELESKYGILILYGEETFWNFSNDNIQKLRDKNYIKIGMNNLKSELSRYPEGFFSEFSRKLRIFMITSFESDYSGMASYGTPGYFDLYLTATSYSIETLHHEIMHMIDFTMNEKNGYAGFHNWSLKNPSGFSYTGADYSDDQYVYDGIKSLSTCYFVSNYSKKSDYEDRAEIFKSLMMNKNINQYFSLSNPIQLKIQYLSSEIRRVFKTVQAVNTAEWEKYLK